MSILDLGKASADDEVEVMTLGHRRLTRIEVWKANIER